MVEQPLSPLVFNITSAHISEADDVNRKHVTYTLEVRHVHGNSEYLIPSTIERRYTDFYNLYMTLRNEEPELMSSITFPRKVLIGNFDNKVISTRSTGFESLLKYISEETRLHKSPSLLSFLQDKELENAKKFLSEQQYFFALPLLENNFQLLNKVYTNRSPPVLLALCRLLGCSLLLNTTTSLKWADLALSRFDGVSDSDLLQLYVPLLQACNKLWKQNDRDAGILDERLQNIKRVQCNFDENASLLDTVNEVEQKIYPLTKVM